MARQVMVHYKVKPDRIEEHEKLIRDVFAELALSSPAGIRYGAFKQKDGLRFVHVALITAANNPLDAIAAFRAFSERIKERCDEPPNVVDLTPIGVFGL